MARIPVNKSSLSIGQICLFILVIPDAHEAASKAERAANPFARTIMPERLAESEDLHIYKVLPEEARSGAVFPGDG